MNNNVKFNKITKKLSSLLNKNNYKRILIITGKNLSGVNEDRLKNNLIKISINDIKYILLNY